MVATSETIATILAIDLEPDKVVARFKADIGFPHVPSLTPFHEN